MKRRDFICLSAIAAAAVTVLPFPMTVDSVQASGTITAIALGPTTFVAFLDNKRMGVYSATKDGYPEHLLEDLGTVSEFKISPDKVNILYPDGTKRTIIESYYSHRIYSHRIAS